MTDPTPRPASRARSRRKNESLDPDAVRARLEGALDFPAAVREAMQDARAAGADAVSANQASLEGLDEHIARTFDAIEKELEKPDLSPRERLALIDKMTELLVRRDTKDTENKSFLHGLTQDRMKTTLLIVGAAAATVVAAVAGSDGLKELGKLAPQVAKRAISK